MKFDFDFNTLVADPRVQALQTREDKERLRRIAFQTYATNDQEFSEWFLAQTPLNRRMAFAAFEQAANEATPDFWTYEAQPARTRTIRQQGIEMQMYIPVADTGGRSPMLPWDQEYIYNFLKDTPKEKITGIDRETLQFYAGIASTRGDEFAGVNEWVKESLEEQAGPNAQARLIAGNILAPVTQAEKAMAWVAGKAFDAIGHRYTDDISNQVTPFATREQFEAMEQLYPVSSVVGSMAGILGSALVGYGILQAGTQTTNAFRAGQTGLRFFNGKMILGYAGINSAISVGYMDVAPGLIASVLDRPDSVPLNLAEGLMLGMVFDLGIDAARTLVGVSGREAIRRIKSQLTPEETLRIMSALDPKNADLRIVSGAVDTALDMTNATRAKKIMEPFTEQIERMKDVIFGPEGMSLSESKLYRRTLAEKIRSLDPTSQIDSTADNFLEQVVAWGNRKNNAEVLNIATTVLDSTQWARIVRDAATKPINELTNLELMAMSMNNPAQRQYIEATRRLAAGDAQGPVNRMATEAGEEVFLTDAQYIAAFERNPRYFTELAAKDAGAAQAATPTTPETVKTVIKPKIYNTLDDAIGARVELFGEEGILIRLDDGNYAIRSGDRITEIPDSFKDGTKTLSDLGVEPVAARTFTNPTVDADGVIIRGVRYATPSPDDFALDDTGRIISVTLQGENGPRTFRDPAVARRLGEAILDQRVAREAPEQVAEALVRSPETPALQSIEGMIHPMTKQVMGALNLGESVLPDGRILGGTADFGSQTADILSPRNLEIVRSNLNRMIDETAARDLTSTTKDRVIRILQDKLKVLDDYESGKLYPSGVRSGDADTTRRLNQLREIADSLKPDTLARIERGELGELGVPELRRVARLFGIPRSSKLKKADLVSSIDARLERVFQPRELRMRDFSGGPALPEEVSRYNEILRLLPEDVSFNNLQQWKLDNPELYRELREIRERVLDRAGYNNAAFHGTKKPGFVTFSFDKLGDNTGAQSARLAFFGTSSPEVAHFYAGQKALNDRLDALLSKIFKGGSMDRVSGAFDALTTQSKHFDGAADDLLDISNGIKKAHSMTLNPVGIVEQYLDGLNGFLKILDPEISSGFLKIIKSAQDTLGRKARSLQKLAGDAPENLERDFLLKRVIPLMDSILLDMLDASRALRRQTDALIDKISIQEFGAEKIMDLRFGFKNPKVIDMKGGRYTGISISKSIRDAMADGHDGLILRNFVDPDPVSDHFIAFHPGQIKSADPLTAGPDGKILGLNDLGGQTLQSIDESMRQSSQVLSVIRQLEDGKTVSGMDLLDFKNRLLMLERTLSDSTTKTAIRAVEDAKFRNDFDLKSPALEAVNYILGWKGLSPEFREPLQGVRSALTKIFEGFKQPTALGRRSMIMEGMSQLKESSLQFRQVEDLDGIVRSLMAGRLIDDNLPLADSKLVREIVSMSIVGDMMPEDIMRVIRTTLDEGADIRTLPAQSWRELEPAAGQGTAIQGRGIEQQPMFSKKIPTSVMDDLTAPSRELQLQGQAFDDFTLATQRQIDSTEELNRMFPERTSSASTPEVPDTWANLNSRDLEARGLSSARFMNEGQIERARRAGGIPSDGRMPDQPQATPPVRPRPAQAATETPVEEVAEEAVTPRRRPRSRSGRIRPRRLTNWEQKMIKKHGINFVNPREGTPARTVADQAIDNPQIIPENAAPQIDPTGVANGDIQSLINLMHATKTGLQDTVFSANTLLIPKIPEGVTAFEHALGILTGVPRTGNADIDAIALAMITGNVPKSLKKKISALLDNKEFNTQFFHSQARNDLRRLDKLVKSSDNPEQTRAALHRYWTSAEDDVRGTLPANIEDLARRLKQQRMENSVRLAEQIRVKSGEPHPFIERLDTYMHRAYKAFIGNPRDWMDYVKRTPSQYNPDQTIWDYTREWVAKNWNDHLMETMRDTYNIENAAARARWENDMVQWELGGMKGRKPRKPRQRESFEMTPEQLRRAGGLVDGLNPGDPSLLEQAGYILEQYLSNGDFLKYALNLPDFSHLSRGIFNARVNIPEVMRKFLGELDDPIESMGVTLVKQRKLAEQYDMQLALRQTLLDSGAARTIPSEGRVPLGGEQYVRENPLSGLFVNPTIRQLLVNASIIDSGELPKIFTRLRDRFWSSVADTYFGGVAFAKAGVTVYSPRGYASNAWGAFMNFAQQGHLNLYHYAKAIGTAGEITDTTLARILPSGIDEPQIQMAVDALNGVNGLGQSIGVRSFTASLDKIRRSTPGSLQWLKNMESHILKHWTVSDDASKIAAFLGENMRYKHLKDTRFGGDEVAYSRWLADRVMQTNQDYSRLPELMKRMTERDFGVTPFLNFRYDQMRISVNTAKIVFSDLVEGIATGDWRLVLAAAQRFTAYTMLGVGLPTFQYGAGVVGIGSVFAVREAVEGVDRAPDPVRSFLVPGWMSEQTTAIMGWDATSGTYTTWDLTFLAPASNTTRFFLEALNGFIQGDTAMDKLAGVSNVVFNEFVGMGYLTPEVIQGISGFDEYGRRITEREGLAGVADRVAHVMGQVQFTGIKTAKSVFEIASRDISTGSFGDRVTSLNMGMEALGQRSRTTSLIQYFEAVSRQAAFDRGRRENKELNMLIPARGAASVIWARENKGFSPTFHSDDEIVRRLQSAGYSRTDSERILSLGYEILRQSNVVGE